mmetsp:Transcript_22524/g.19505  ORF Transcript_22524/g.19505 Transcript_22524/m.19505 type:complete len:146 (+) Transcript_22524:78-515(+)
METLNTTHANIKPSSEQNSSECLSPVKNGCYSIDLFELVPYKNAKLSTHASSYETASTRTEDDSSKSVYCEENTVKENNTTSKSNKVPESQMTLKEIISRRCHQRKAPKTAQKAESKEYLSKRKLDRQLIQTEETVDKKGKLNSE